jgi:hypothetical protein
MIKKFGNLLFILLFVSALTACNDDDEPDVTDTDPGTFEVTVTGDTEGEFGGTAICYHGLDPDTNTEIFALILSPGTTQGIAIYFGKTGSRPAKGTYPIRLLDVDENEEWDLSPDFAAWAFKGSEEWFYSKSGSITFNSVSAETMTGSFDLTTEGFRVSEDYTSVIEIEAGFKGNFNAIFVDVLPNIGSSQFQLDLN